MNYQPFISPQTQFYQLPEALPLESGAVLPQVQVAYRTWGQLNDRGDNGVLVCHAFTGSADVENWWEPLLGPGRALDPTQDFIVCSNILGSCYGTTGAASQNPATGKPYGPTFPAITIRDMVRVQALLLEALGVRWLRLAIGGSLGGMQVLEWALLYPERVGAIVPIAVSGRHSAWCIGLSEAQRQAIYADPGWQGGHYAPHPGPTQGLAVARMIALHTYRNWVSFNDRFGRQAQAESPRDPAGEPEFAIVHYLKYQGQKLVERFDANSYISLTQAMDRYDLTRPGQTYGSTLQSLKPTTLVVGIPSDLLYPPAEQQELASLIPKAELAWLDSVHGHDAFLIDMAPLNTRILQFRHQDHGVLKPTPSQEKILCNGN